MAIGILSLHDLTTIKAHPCATGYYKNSSEKEALGRSKGGLTTKIHAAVDALGNAFKFIIGPGNGSDFKVSEQLIEGIRDAAIIGDKGYDSNPLRELIKSQNCEPVIPGKSNRIIPTEYDKELYKARHLVENFFAKIKNFRRIFARFDKSVLAFGSSILWLR